MRECVCVCVCVRERKRERERAREREKRREERETNISKTNEAAVSLTQSFFRLWLDRGETASASCQD